MTRIALLGLGNRGAPMAANLVKAGQTVVGFDPIPSTPYLRPPTTSGTAGCG